MVSNIVRVVLVVLSVITAGLAAVGICCAHEGTREMAMEQQEGPVVVLRTDPAIINTGVEETLTIALSDSAGNPLRGLSVIHDRIMHVIIASQDFTVFSHIHPEDFGPITESMRESAKYPVHYSFPKAGSYIIGVDFAVKDKAYSRHFTVDVSGGKPMGEATVDLARKKKFGDYEVTLMSSPESITAGKEVTLSYSFSKDGAPVTDLEPYLSAYMHAAVMSQNFQYFMHEHGMAPGMAEHAHHMMMHSMAVPKKFGPVVDLSITFPSKGIYQVFGEVKHKGKVILTSFMVEVK